MKTEDAGGATAAAAAVPKQAVLLELSRIARTLEHVVGRESEEVKVRAEHDCMFSHPPASSRR